MAHVSYLSRELKRLRHTNVIYTTDLRNKNDGTTDLKRNEFEVKTFPMLFHFKDYFYTPKMKKELLKEDFNLIHAHCYRNYQTDLAAWLAKKVNKPFILTAHGTIKSVEWCDAILKRAYDWVTMKRTIRRADAFVAVAKGEIEQFKELGVNEEKIFVIPHGVDTETFRPNIDPSNFLDNFKLYDSQLILYAGRLHKRKGIHYLIKAFKDISKNFKDVKLVVAGSDRGYQMPLIKLRNKLKLQNRVIFTGHLSKNMLIQAYNAAFIFVYPAKYEVFGQALLEASACGTPCIATKWGASNDIIVHGKTGLLINGYGNLRDLKKSVLYLLKNPNKATEMGLVAREYVSKNFSWKKCAAKHIALYNKVLGY